MTYYKVPANLDGHPVYRVTRSGARVPALFLVPDELYTGKECRRYGINPDALQPVNVSPRRIYWFFGARFEMGV